MTRLTRSAPLGLLCAGTVLCGYWLFEMGRMSAVAALAPRHAPAYSAAGKPRRGDLLARIDIPGVGIGTAVLEGADDEILARASGHIPGTAAPGGLGNFAVAGHRDTIFRNLRKVRPGMDIFVTSITGRYRYRIRSTTIVSPDQVEVLDVSLTPTLTLITCYPFYYVGPAPKRFCLSAELVGIE